MLLLATLAASALVLQPIASQTLSRVQPRSGVARLALEEFDQLTLTLKDCLAGGVGLGLDENNKIDLIKPDSPASKVCAMGDEVLTWNGEALLEAVQGRMVQRKLKDVVTPAESHTLVVRRVRKSWSTNYESPDWSSSNSWSGESSWG